MMPQPPKLFRRPLPGTTRELPRRSSLLPLPESTAGAAKPQRVCDPLLRMEPNHRCLDAQVRISPGVGVRTPAPALMPFQITHAVTANLNSIASNCSHCVAEQGMHCEEARRHSTTLSKVAAVILGFGSSSTTLGETGGATASAPSALVIC